MIDSHSPFPALSAFAGAMGVRVGSGLPHSELSRAAHRLASSYGWALRPNGRRVSQ